MNNNWKVEYLDIDQISPYDNLKVSAEISGFLDVKKLYECRFDNCNQVFNIVKEFIEKRLNTNNIEGWKKTQRVKSLDSRMVPGIKNVIFNDPLTIIVWSDGTKTFVKASENDAYDPEKGMALAIAKKAMGNKYSYYDEIRKWITKDTERKSKNEENVGLILSRISKETSFHDALKRAVELAKLFRVKEDEED